MCLLNEYANKISMLARIGKSVMRFPILMLCLFAVSSSVQAAQSFKRLALVIGNDYVGTPFELKSPIRDAKAMTETLRKLGFHVLYQENANLAEMNKAIEAFLKKLDKQTDGLFYFSGHGISGSRFDKSDLKKEVNYLVPNDKEIINATTRIDPKALMAFADIVKKMDKRDSHLNIVIVDACRSPRVVLQDAGEKGLMQEVADMYYKDSYKKTYLPTNLFVGYATLSNTAAREFDNASIYTEHLLKLIQVPGLTITNLFDQVRESVKQEYKQKRALIKQGYKKKNKPVPDLSDLQQLPEHLPLMADDFYFAGKLKAPRIDTF
jgi:uncharacterized caspase-like protein